MNTDFILRIEETSERKGNPFMLAFERLSNAEIAELELEQIAPNKQYLFCSSTEDISVETEFDIIFPRANPKEYVSVKSILRWVSINRSIKSDTLLAGYRAIVIIEFPALPPAILSRLSYYNDPIITGKNDGLYFTNQRVMDKVLSELKK
jgi:hypothetical protein